MEDGASTLLSVAACGSDSASSPRVTPCAASLLFSLQLYVDSVALTASVDAEKAFLLGFQLLQYEIVVFDASLATAETQLRHGKSCLFEAEPDELLRELRRDAEAPLTLLLLLQEHGRARLQAFGAVPLSLHVGLLHEGVRHKICEWASYSGRWELRDHRNGVVGHVAGAVTLSCLGKALAPHLTRALGVQVSKSQSSGEGTVQEEEAEVQQVGEKVKVDAGVQCDDMVEQRVAESVSSSLGDRSRIDDVQDEVKTKSLRKEEASVIDSSRRQVDVKTNSLRKDGGMLYYKRSKGAASPRRRSHRSSRESITSRNASMSAVKSELLFPRELPPPLFFQKGAKS